MAKSLNNTNVVFAAVFFAVILFAVLFGVNKRISNEMDDSSQNSASVFVAPQIQERKPKNISIKDTEMLSSNSEDSMDNPKSVGSKGTIKDEKEIISIQEEPLDEIILIQ